MWEDILMLIIALCLFVGIFILKFIPIVFFVYLGVKVSKRMYTNIKMDSELNIDTLGTRKWKNGTSKMYHRTESSPYQALETLYEKHDLDKKDRVVDFGAGRGRVAFFIHKYFNVDVVGIELNEITFEETEANLKQYHTKFGHFEHKIEFQCIGAENYKFDKKDNTYFFFNPFNHTIFKNVIDNIIEDADRNGKDIKVVLYYPTRSYRKVMKKTDFKIIDKFKPKGRITPTEKFIIYEREY